jgi:pimeloyl-ACP methyl ester carboxylesterase
VDGWRVAYIDEGIGPPVVLLHGCPFSSWEWKDVIPDSESALQSDRTRPAGPRRHSGPARR